MGRVVSQWQKLREKERECGAAISCGDAVRLPMREDADVC
jgi:hypothetical protein